MKIIMLLLLVLSCGKKAEQASGPVVIATPPITSEQERLLNSQELLCEQGQSCPTYLTKIIVREGNELKFCTGFLTGPSTVATSSSCLSSLLRLSEQDCSQDVHIYFARTSSRPAERVGCKTVLQASALNGTDPVLWRDDVSFLQLSKNMPSRKYLEINRDGFSDLSEYTIWSAEQVSEKSAFIRKQECNAVLKTYINPLVTSRFSPNMTMAGCQFLQGSTGSPIVDDRGVVRGNVSVDMDKGLRETINGLGLLLPNRPLRSIIHASSFACAPSVYDNNVADEHECSKTLNYQVLDRNRSDSLNMKTLYAESLKKIEAGLGKLSPYLNFSFQIKNSKLDIQPSCYKKVSTWLGSLSGYKDAFQFGYYFPQRTFKPMMDVYGRVIGQEIFASDKYYNFEFYLRSFRSQGTSVLYRWDLTSTQTYNNLTETCPALLF